ncbi:MAG: acyltransferase [Bacilli bacterium]|nr:acyltransferase [Bacilli bacterium]
MTSFYSEEELKNLGLKGYGKNVRISRKASFYSIENILLGDNVRIDDFCILSGNITIGNNVHISAYCALYGKYGIEFQDFSGCSSRTTIYSETDDFSGDYMIGAVLPEELTNVFGSKVVVSKFAQLGANTVVMPGVVVKEGAVTGAFTFVNKDLDEWTINCGIPCKVLKGRSKKLLELLNKSNE